MGKSVNRKPTILFTDPTAQARAVAMYVDEKKSLSQIAAAFEVSMSTVRLTLIRCGVKLRIPYEAAAASGLFNGHFQKGKKKGPFSETWRQNISQGRLAWGERNAKGTSLKSSGYIQLTRGENLHRGEHVVIMEQRIGRKLLPDECIHHIDGNRSNNSLDNLALVTRSAHGRLHQREYALAGYQRKRQANGTFC